MSLSQSSELTEVDADGAAVAADDAAGDALRAVAEFTAEDYRLLYARTDLVERYGTDGLDEVARRIHDYIHLDFGEREMYEEVLPAVEETRAFVTMTDVAAVVRVLVDEEGVFCSLDAGEPVAPVVEAVEAAL